ncbi:MAG: hypothetical protein NT027_15415 [Proteobacteria bacterium]|nr:hypothetical protein [Pseudomonadota bacterium]
MYSNINKFRFIYSVTLIAGSVWATAQNQNLNVGVPENQVKTELSSILESGESEASNTNFFSNGCSCGNSNPGQDYCSVLCGPTERPECGWSGQYGCACYCRR